MALSHTVLVVLVSELARLEGRLAGVEHVLFVLEQDGTEFSMSLVREWSETRTAVRQVRDIVFNPTLNPNRVGLD